MKELGGKEMGRPGRPRKTEEAPKETFYVTKQIDIDRIKRIVNEAINYGDAPTDPNDFLGAQFAVRYGVLLSAMKQIGEELGI